MADETEIERLVVRLVGDQSDIDKLLDSLEASLMEAAGEMMKVDAVSKGLGKTFNQTSQDTKHLDEGIKQADKALAELEQTIMKGEKVTLEFENAIEKTNRRFGEYQDLLEKGAISQETFNRATTKAFVDLMQADEGLKKISGNLTSFGQTMSLYVTAPLTAMGAIAVHEFSVMESTSLKLDAALEANGRAVGELGQRYRNFGAEMQKRTKIGDDDVIQLLQEAESLGITGDAAERAAKNAIALGAAKGIAAASALRMTVALEQGNAQMLQRHLPTLKSIKDPTEKAAKAQELLGKMFGVAEADAKSFSGQLVQLKNEFGDFMEEIGRVIAGGLTPLVGSLKDTVTWLQGLSPAMKTVVVVTAALAAGIGPLLFVLGSLAGQINSLIILYGQFTAAQIAAIGTAGGFAAGLALIGAGAYYIYHLNQDVQDLNAALRESEELSRKMSSQRSTTVGNIIAQGSDMETGDRRNFIRDHMESAEKSVEGLQQRLEATKQAIAENGAETKSWENIIKTLVNPLSALSDASSRSAQGDVLRQNLTEETRALSDAKEAAGRFRAELEAISQVKLDEKHQADIEKFTHHLEMKVKYHGLSADAIKYEELQLKGMSEVQQAHIQTLLLQEEAQKKADKAMKDMAASAKKAEADSKHHKDALDAVTKSLQAQVTAFGQHSSAKQIEQLKLKGYSDDELKEARKAAAELEKLEKHKKLVEEGKQFTNRHLNKADKLKQEQAEAKKLLDAGVISVDTYNKALKQMDAELRKPHKLNVQKIEATDVASAEAISHLLEFAAGRADALPTAELGRFSNKGKIPEAPKPFHATDLTGSAISQPGSEVADRHPRALANPHDSRLESQKGIEEMVVGINRLVAIAEKTSNKPTVEIIDSGLSD